MKKMINILAIATVALSTQAMASGALNHLSKMMDPPSPSKEAYMLVESGAQGKTNNANYSFEPAAPSKETHMGSVSNRTERATVNRSVSLSSYPMTPPAPSKEASMIP